MMLRRDFLLAAGTVAVAAADTEPYKNGRGWKALIQPGSLKGWLAESNKPSEWTTAKNVTATGKLLEIREPGGTVLVNGPKGRTANIYTTEKFGNCELYVEFMVPQGSNSGVYLQGLYEIQVFDSYGVAKPQTSDCGAIYHRWIHEKPVGGSAPRVNASKPPGEWQSFHAFFRAAKFDGGRKISNARFDNVLHNGVLVQENVEVDGGTRSHMQIDEAPSNPLMLQGDHGPVAYRNLYIRATSR